MAVVAVVAIRSDSEVVRKGLQTRVNASLLQQRARPACDRHSDVQTASVWPLWLEPVLDIALTIISEPLLMYTLCVGCLLNE